MTFQQKLMIISTLAALTGAVVVASRPGSGARRGDGSSRTGVIGVCLGIVAGALLIVGLVSHTPLRHAVQVTPVVIAAIPAIRRSALASVTAAPIFAFWFLTMGAIWLFLLGIARFFTGRFTPTEIMLTVIIGLASVAGLVAAFRRRTVVSDFIRFSTVVVFALLQFAAMWVSVLPSIARR